MPSSGAMRRWDQPRCHRDRMVSIMATLSRFDMVCLVEYGGYSQGYFAILRLLKVAGFQAPIAGWISAPADKKSQLRSPDHSQPNTNSIKHLKNNNSDPRNQKPY